MSSILLHGVGDIDVEELILRFENQFKDNDIAHLEVSRKFDSAIIYFKNEKSAKRILDKGSEVVLNKIQYNLKMSNEKYLPDKVDQILQNNSDTQPNSLNYTHSNERVCDSKFNNVEFNALPRSYHEEINRYVSSTGQCQKLKLDTTNELKFCSEGCMKIYTLNSCSQSLPRENEDKWDMLNNSNELRKNNAKPNNDESRSNHYSRVFVINDGRINKSDKNDLIKRMIKENKIKNGFNFVKNDDGLFEIRSNNQGELNVYYKQLSDMFDSYSERQLEVSNNLEKTLKDGYGLNWGNNILLINKVIGILTLIKDTLCVIGFSDMETKNGLDIINNNLVTAQVKYCEIDLKKYLDVEIKPERGSNIVRGLPIYVIKAVHKIQCSGKSFSNNKNSSNSYSDVAGDRKREFNY